MLVLRLAIVMSLAACYVLSPSKAVAQTVTMQPECPVVAKPDLSDFRFGKDYLRIYIDSIYVPMRGDEACSVLATVTTNNQTPLTFKFALEPQPRKVYSARGAYFLLPYVALNVKSPLTIDLEVRTRKDYSGYVTILQGVISAAANVFTGGAASTISGLTRYADVTQTLVSSYESNTAQTDMNRTIIFDAANAPCLRDSSSELIAVFTRGKGSFGATRGSVCGPSIVLRESSIAEVLPADAPDEALCRTPYKFVLKPSARSFTCSQPDIAYPDGECAFLEVHIEAYQPYSGILSNPEQVTAVRDRFRGIRALAIGHKGNLSELAVLLRAEGAELRDSLDTLTDAGDLSLADAKALMGAYIQRAKSATECSSKEFCVLEAMLAAMPDQTSNAPSCASP